MLLRIKFILSLTLMLAANAASAACVQGKMRWTGSTVVYCYDGTNERTVAATSTGSGCATVGEIIYNGVDLVYCNGSLWYRLNHAADTYAAACATAGRFYFDTGNQYYWMCQGQWKQIP